MNQPARAAAPATRTPAQSLERAVGILGKYKRGAEGELALRRFGATHRDRTIVLVGEVNRGKSFLADALAGARGASPVDFDTCTSASVHLEPAGDPGQIELRFPGGSRAVAASELREWITTGGSYVRDAELDELPTAAAVHVPDSRMPGVTIVDTPGVGGLDPAAARMAVASAQSAGVLVMVCDASTPITAPELEFLREASASVESIVVAVTKTDKNLRRWRDIVADDVRLLREHMGRDIPVVGVSCLRGLSASEQADPELRARREQTSGIAELRRVLLAELARGDSLPEISGLRTAREALTKVVAGVEEELAQAGQGLEILPELERRRDEFKRWRDYSQEWEQFVQRDVTLLRQNVLRNLDKQLDETRERWKDRITKNGVKVLRKNPQVFTAQIEAELKYAMEQAMFQTYQGLRSIFFALMDDEAVWQHVAGKAYSTLEPPQVKSGEVQKKTKDLVDPSVLTMGVVGSGALAALVPIGGIVAGAVWIGVNLGYKAMRNGRQNLLSWLNETLNTTRVSTNRMVEIVMSTARPEIITRYRAHVRSRVEELQEQIQKVKAQADADRAQQQKTLERLGKNKQIISATIAELAAHEKQLAAPRREAAPGIRPAASAVAAPQARIEPGRPLPETVAATQAAPQLGGVR